MKRLFSALTNTALAIVLVLGLSSGALAQSEITLLAPMPIQESMDKLVAGFEAKTGMHVKATYGSGLGTRKQVASGQALDAPCCSRRFRTRWRRGTLSRRAPR